MSTIEVLLADGLMIVVGLGLAVAGGFFAERCRRDVDGHYRRRSGDRSDDK